MASASPWSDLQIDLLSLIFEKFGDDFDLLSSCASVCVSWHSAIHKLSQHLLHKEPFQLLLTGSDDDQDNGGSRLSLIDILNLKTYKIRVNPGLHERWIRSHSDGWLLTIGRAWPHEINLMNPVTGKRIRVPPAGNQFNPSEGLMVVTSGNPSDSKCMVVGIHSLNKELVICKPGDQTWTRIEHSCPNNVYFRSAIFYKGEFYVLSDLSIGHYDSIGRIRFDMNHSVHDLFMEELIRMPPPSPTAKLLFHYHHDDLEREFVYIFSYLVELMDDLLIVLKYKHLNPEDKSRRFEVYRLKLEGDKEWVPVESLGNNGIYLDRPSSISVTIGEENSRECRANCIYFVERREQWIDRGVYDMETKITQWSPLISSS